MSLAATPIPLTWFQDGKTTDINSTWSFGEDLMTDRVIERTLSLICLQYLPLEIGHDNLSSSNLSASFSSKPRKNLVDALTGFWPKTTKSSLKKFDHCDNLGNSLDWTDLSSYVFNKTSPQTKHIFSRQLLRSPRNCRLCTVGFGHDPLLLEEIRSK